MGPFFNPASVLTILLMLLNGGVRDLSSCISTETYWHAKNVAVTADQLIHEIDAPAPADLPKLIADLDADDPRTRDEAARKLYAYGTAAIPALNQATKSPSPEVVTRSNALITRIHANKATAIRRLMAIRTLGERKEVAALPVLHALLDSKEMFEAEYSAAAIARIEGKPFNVPVATEAERSADLALLPARLDIAAQAAPEIAREFSIEKEIADSPMPQAEKTAARDETVKTIIEILETVGNIRLNSITWGFYAAPHGQPGNTLIIARGLFDRTALAAAIAKDFPHRRRIKDIDIFQQDEDSAILLANDGRVIYLARESTGELGLDDMIAALQKGAGDFNANPDLPKLVKSVDTRAPLWLVLKMASGLKEISGPLADFDTATLVAKQSLDKGSIVTDIKLQAVGSGQKKAADLVDAYTKDLRDATEKLRAQQKTMPLMRPLADFVAGIQLQADGDKVTLTGSMRDMPMSLGDMIMSESEQMVFPNPPPR